MSLSITRLMVNEHNNVSSLLEECIKSFKKSEEHSQRYFEKFSWALKKHIFGEEKVVFSSPLLKKEVGVFGVEKLLEEHKEILELQKEIEDNFDFNLLEELRELLKSHEKNEERNFYPKIDDELSDEEKRSLVERIKAKIF